MSFGDWLIKYYTDFSHNGIFLFPFKFLSSREKSNYNKMKIKKTLDNTNSNQTFYSILSLRKVRIRAVFFLTSPWFYWLLAKEAKVQDN